MEIKTWSYSRLSTLTTCSQKYKYRYIENLEREQQGLNLVRGKIVHEISQSLLSVSPSDHGIEFIKRQIERQCSPEDVQELKDLDKYCADIIAASKNSATEVERIKKEWAEAVSSPDVKMNIEENIKFEVRKRNGQIGGIMTTYLDLHFICGKRHLVIELKTTSRTPSDGDATLSHKKQAIIYNEALKAMYGEFTESMDYYIVYAVILSKEIKIIPVKIDFTAFDYYDDVIGELWSQIRTANELESTGSFNRVLSDQICGWCDYKELCLEGKAEGFKKKEVFVKS